MGQEQEFHQVNTMEQEFGLVVDGAALTLIMPLQENRELLYQVHTRIAARGRFCWLKHDKNPWSLMACMKGD